MKSSLASLLALLLGLWMPLASNAEDGAATVARDRLPVEARETLARIEAGGPFKYRQDGVVFGNREHRLPQRERGYYHEYTVPTPGARDRGARRIIAGASGKESGQRSAPERARREYWYTADHYNSFARITDRND